MSLEENAGGYKALESTLLALEAAQGALRQLSPSARAALPPNLEEVIEAAIIKARDVLDRA